MNEFKKPERSIATIVHGMIAAIGWERVHSIVLIEKMRTPTEREELKVAKNVVRAIMFHYGWESVNKLVMDEKPLWERDSWMPKATGRLEDEK